MKTGIIDVGGGTRGIYGTGVMDYLMDNGIEFDCHIGVSAGAANLSSYIAGQRGRKNFDGGLMDPVPIEKAMEMDCDKVVVILTKPRDLYRETDTDAKWSLLIEASYPDAVAIKDFLGP